MSESTLLYKNHNNTETKISLTAFNKRDQNYEIMKKTERKGHKVRCRTKKSDRKKMERKLAELMRLLFEENTFRSKER